MSIVFSVAMIVTAGLSACCLPLDPHRRSARVCIPPIVMLVAMIDLATSQLVPPVAWCAGLLVTGIWSTASRRPTEEDVVMRVYRALSCIAMGGLVVSHGFAAPTHSGHTMLLGSLPTLIAAGTIIIGGFAVGRSARSHRRVAAVEATLMALSLIAMSVHAASMS